MNKLTIPIIGMHCRSCELLIEEKLSNVSGVTKSVVHYKTSIAEVYYQDQEPNMNAIETAIVAAGYKVGLVGKKAWFSSNIRDYKEFGIAILFVLGAYWLLKSIGLTNLSVSSGANPTGLGVVLLVGLTAGFSTCMALVGGLILGISARHAEKHPEATPVQKFRPHLFFNLGRIMGYALLGGILGAVGSVLQLSAGMLGLLTIVVGGVMLLMGAKLVGVFPRLETVSISLPASVSKLFGIKKHEKEYSHKSSMLLGALTFFLPCGFTQAMQLYAVSTGSFTQGVLIMGLFAVGTAPGLLGIGGLTATVKGLFAQRFFKVAGVVVILFALFNINNGLNLTGWKLGSATPANNATLANDPNVTLENGVQVVRMAETGSGYSPNQFTVKKGVPVKWIINAQAPYSCASSIMMSSYNIRKNLVAGENIIEFTPTASGQATFSCSMGMYTGVFNVIDNTASTTVSNAAIPVATVPTSAADQVIQTVYTYNNDIQPNAFTVKAGRSVRLEINAKENGSGCMSTIMIPGLYENPELLVAGEKIIMQFTPTKTGNYDITCAMGVPRGTIKVE
ncbi:MAG: sulfite exporter TauE/SafE family protein [Patescibacteria group bacterium]|jgi:sulfite exporter TauE/SafE/copper chaperone CopZ